MTDTATQAQTIEQMMQWAIDNYTNGADTIAECWGREDYADLIAECDNDTAKAWDMLRRLADVYSERQADARNSAF